MLKFSGMVLSLFAAMLLVTNSGSAQEKQAEEPAEQQQKKLQVNKRASSSMCSFIVCDYKTGRIVDPKTFDIVRVTPLTDKNGTKLTPAQQKAGTKKPGQISKKMTIGIMEDLKVGNAKKRAFEVQGLNNVRLKIHRASASVMLAVSRVKKVKGLRPNLLISVLSVSNFLKSKLSVTYSSRTFLAIVSLRKAKASSFFLKNFFVS